MADAKAGEVSLLVGEASYTLVLDDEELCEAETAFDTPIYDLISRMRYLGTLRILLWAALRRHHPEAAGYQDGKPDLRQVGRIHKAIGFSRLTTVVGDVLSARLSDAADEGGEAPPLAEPAAATA